MEDSFLTTKQIFIGRKPEKKKFDEIKNRDYFNKPAGGLWTSTYKMCEDCGIEETSWNCWAKNNLPEKVNDKRKMWQVTPDYNARIYTINSRQDYMILLNQFNQSGNPRPADKYSSVEETSVRKFESSPITNYSNYLDFESIAKNYDAIYLSEKGLYYTGSFDARLPGLGLYGWDCESTVWLNWCFDNVSQFFPTLSSVLEESNIF